MMLVASRTGLRIGELRALRWDDVDLVARRMVVRKNLVHGRMGSPKNGRNREIPLCDSAGLRRIGFHVLRHTFASHMVMRGVPLKVVQDLLGHSTIGMTMRYSHLSPEVTREYVNMLDEKFRVLKHTNSTSRPDGVQLAEITG